MEKTSSRGSKKSLPPALWAAVLGGLVVGAILIGLAVSGADKKDDQPALAKGDIFRSIPQSDIYAGDSDAPVTLVEFADMQCPYCGAFGTEVVPRIVEEFVAAGKLRLEFRVITFVGEDSERAARAVAGAGRQNKLWSFVHAFYERQGEENTGYVTDAYLHEIADAANVSFDKIIEAQDDPTIGKPADDAAELAKVHKINSTPSFLIRRGDGVERFDPGSIEADKFLDALRAELNK